jgi:thiamine-phosphate pyrophosphorylase
MKPLSDCRLYTFVDAAYLAGRDPGELARQLCDGGADLVQVRAKGWDRDAVRRLVESVFPVVSSAGAWCVLNDDWDLGCEMGVPCVHLGQEDFFDAGLRRISELKGCGMRPALGLSSHAPDQFERARVAGADYIAVGPVFPTGTKPGRPAVTLDYVRWAAAQEASVPWFAIGGIHLGNLDAVLEAGARRICVVSAILQSGDVAGATREFCRRLGQVTTSGDSNLDGVS